MRVNTQNQNHPLPVGLGELLEGETSHVILRTTDSRGFDLHQVYWLTYLKGHGPDYAHDRGTPPATPRNSSLWLPVSFQ